MSETGENLLREKVIFVHLFFDRQTVSSDPVNGITK